ncbi:hypothetical protein BDQ12DRAFT_75078 [Crucibulum laeve]|uniref:Uncharacterized protein n=1 Tax=Crucibulum laeve TaxID=68775 RepID=A0A5C3M3U6_9AGAR|nr:hypothetical protein BDQ12DRAFT_75078 [Crucibulum laeve]
MLLAFSLFDHCDGMHYHMLHEVSVAYRCLQSSFSKKLCSSLLATLSISPTYTFRAIDCLNTMKGSWAKVNVRKRLTSTANVSSRCPALRRCGDLSVMAGGKFEAKVAIGSATVYSRPLSASSRILSYTIAYSRSFSHYPLHWASRSGLYYAMKLQKISTGNYPIMNAERHEPVIHNRSCGC